MPNSEPIESGPLSRALAGVTEDALETMFYLFPEEQPSADGNSLEPPVSALFRFRGQPSGAVLISLSLAAARTATANFLALDESEPGTEQIGEVVCELANMIGGTLMSAIENGSPLQLFPPELAPAGIFAGQQPAASHTFFVENGELAVSLYWEQ